MTLILQTGKWQGGPHHTVCKLISTQCSPSHESQKSLGGQGRGKGGKVERGVVRKQSGSYIPQ